MSELEKLQRDAGLKNPPTALTYDLRVAVSGEGPRAYDWSDKPHRLLYDACAELEAQAQRIAELEARLEIDHAWQSDGSGKLVRIPAPKGMPDGIECRDETIKLLEERIAKLAAQPSSTPLVEALVEKINARAGYKVATIPLQEGPASIPGPEPKPVAREAWRPIETAPKGGGAELVTDPAYVEPPRILIQCGNEGVAIAYWDAYYAEGGAGCTDGFAWIEPFSGDPLNLIFTDTPTRWMPIPPTQQPASGVALDLPPIDGEVVERVKRDIASNDAYSDDYRTDEILVSKADLRYLLDRAGVKS